MAIANARFPVLRFASPHANYGFFVTAAAVVVVSGAKLLRRTWSRKEPWALLIFPVMLLASALGLGAVLNMFRIDDNGFDPTFERISSLDVVSGRIVVYRTNYAAFAHFGIEVRHEVRVFPGLLLVRELAVRQADGATIRAEPDGRVRIMYERSHEALADDNLIPKRYVWL